MLWISEQGEKSNRVTNLAGQFGKTGATDFFLFIFLTKGLRYQVEAGM